MTHRSRRAAGRPLLLCLTFALGLALGGCSSDDPPATEGQAPEEVLATAAQQLGETSGVHLSLTTDDLPDGVTGITSAIGVATSAPAFDGALKVRLGGTEFEVPVVAVDGKVYAQIPLTPGWSDVDPAEYGAPDPAQLVSTDKGFATLLGATEHPEAGESVRGGADNSEVLTTYTGTIDGDVMANVIPSSAGDTFDVAYLVTEDGQLREAEMTGVFYPDSDEMTYTVVFEDYGTEQDITAP